MIQSLSSARVNGLTEEYLMDFTKAVGPSTALDFTIIVTELSTDFDNDRNILIKFYADFVSYLLFCHNFQMSYTNGNGPWA